MESIKISDIYENLTDNPIGLGDLIKPKLPQNIPDGKIEESLGSGYIQGILGTGGMATVYKIWNRDLEVNRAVKLLHPNCTEETRQRFQTEIKITAKLHHANIIEIHAVGQWRDLPYIEMELIEGITLDTLIKKKGALPVEVCTSIGILIGRALRYAHNAEYILYGNNYHGVIHRDLKPSNVMISNKGAVKLMDFGIARPTDMSIHTTDGSILGTMQYLSPEQLEGKELDVRTDIYSLGTVLYELITGVKVFPDLNVSRLMMSKVKNHFREIRDFNVFVPLALRQLVHNCLAHNRIHRISGTNEFLSRITDIHRMVSDRTPESILAEYMSTSASGERNEITLRKRSPAVVITFLSASLLIVALIVNFSKFSEMFRVNAGSNVLPAVISENDRPAGNPQINEINVNNIQKESILKDRITTKPDGIQKKSSISRDASNIINSHKYDNQENLNIDYEELFFRQIKNRRFDDALKSFERIPQNAVSDKILIYRIRALRESGQKNGLKDALFTNKINDAEVYLERARYFYEKSEPLKALTELSECGKVSAAYIESATARIEMLYLKAQCKSMVFDINPSTFSQNEALDSWFEVKSELQIAKDHRYYRNADAEMQRITRKMNAGRG